MKKELTVLYLTRYKDELCTKKFEDFLESYKKNKSGVAHNLLIVFKGFNKKNFMNKLLFLKKKKIKFQYFKIKDENDFDLGTYKKISEIIQTKYIFFLNSSSKILCKNWLNYFWTGIKKKGVSIVGATGSYEYVDKLKNMKFPNPHIRTNAFIIETKLIKALFKKFTFRNKIDCYKFESGVFSMTRRIFKKNNCYVVGKDFNFYGVNEFMESNTFKNGNQENLIISDGQTERYDKANFFEKKILSLKTWNKYSLYNYY
jgi:hypothetical protein